jgi:hypothetical protein
LSTSAVRSNAEVPRRVVIGSRDRLVEALQREVLIESRIDVVGHQQRRQTAVAAWDLGEQVGLRHTAPEEVLAPRPQPELGIPLLEVSEDVG